MQTVNFFTGIPDTRLLNIYSNYFPQHGTDAAAPPPSCMQSRHQLRVVTIFSFPPPYVCIRVMYFHFATQSHPLYVQGTWQKFVNLEWKNVPAVDLLKVTKTEGQVRSARRAFSRTGAGTSHR